MVTHDMTSLRADLVTLGEAFEDLIFAGLPRLPRPGEELKTSCFARAVGGGAVITAVAAARLGLRCRVASGLSTSATALLKREGVRFTNLRRAEEPPAVSVALSTAKDRSFVTFNGVNDALPPRLLRAVRRSAARHVHFAFLPRDCARWRRVVAGLRGRGVSTSWDFGWNEPLLEDGGLPGLAAALDYLFLNELEAVLYSRRRTLAEACDHWRRHARNAIIKRGARGSRWLSARGELNGRPWRVRAHDSTGAGDAFNGGFLFALLTGRGPRECLQIGNFVGAMSTRAAGGIDGLPYGRELPATSSERRIHSAASGGGVRGVRTR